MEGNELLGKTFVGAWENQDGTLSHTGAVFLNQDGSARLDIIDYPGMLPYTNEECLNVVFGYFTETITLREYAIILLSGMLSKSTMGGANNYSYKYRYALVGRGDIDRGNGLRFDSLMLSGEQFQKCVVTDDIKVIYREDDNVDYQSKFSKEYWLFKNEDLKVYLWWRISFPLANSREIVIRKHGWLNIEFARPKTFYECLKAKGSLEQFFVILSKDMASFELFELSMGKTNFTVFGLKKSYDYGLDSYHLNFLVRNSEQLFSNWFALENKIGFAIENFHEVFVGKQVPLKNKFLAFCFSLELFHREYYRKTESYSEKRIEQIDAILEKLKGSPHHEWFKYKVAEKQREVSFQDRLIELIADSGVDIFYYDTKEFARKVRATRTKFVHLNDKDEVCFTHEELIRNIKTISDVFLALLNHKLVIGTDPKRESYEHTNLLLLPE